MLLRSLLSNLGLCTSHGFKVIATFVISELARVRWHQTVATVAFRASFCFRMVSEMLLGYHLHTCNADISQARFGVNPMYTWRLNPYVYLEIVGGGHLNEGRLGHTWLLAPSLSPLLTPSLEGGPEIGDPKPIISTKRENTTHCVSRSGFGRRKKHSGNPKISSKPGPKSEPQNGHLLFQSQ